MIKSFGIIPYCIIDNEKYILLVKRRDTHEFVDFMYVRKKTFDINKFSKDEKERILNYSFDEIFEDVNLNKKLQKEYNYYKNWYNFKNLKENCKEILKTSIEYENLVEDNLWEFPKGRMEYGETGFETSRREFKEETNLQYDILDYERKINYSFLGDDNKNYYIEYYICKIPYLIPQKIKLDIGIRKTTISHETSECKWFSVKDLEKNLLSNNKIQNIIKLIKI